MNVLSRLARRLKHHRRDRRRRRHPEAGPGLRAPRKRPWRAYPFIRLVDLMMLLTTVGLLAIPARNGQDVFFIVSLFVVCFPLSTVWSRCVAAPFFGATAPQFHALRKLAAKYTLGVLPNLVGIVATQLFVPDSFRGAQAIFVAFIVLVLGKLGDAYEVAHAFAEAVGKRRWIRERQVHRPLRLVGRRPRFGNGAMRMRMAVAREAAAAPEEPGYPPPPQETDDRPTPEETKGSRTTRRYPQGKRAVRPRRRRNH
ncbi:hypothetical protein [Actinoalloteichus hymeniacidonis]|uniref:Uncharacterized protein n=1 Tax=Actinoalloteichus hymeniacidonis TaxID=340345 RepID=A0AAC9MZX6_9PSEU|nr:hypothetical protein [Actinoalloteichus hymeniacidonis]AOS64964.1 hypothetical protein TL08_20865 [Actinoalloteichus hymeniacidonis]MBB5906961.1 hypothetical protein [Actinoalloteichus hymeniacidonis]